MLVNYTGMAPLFSIITVTRNAETTLPATLRSVEEQTCPLFEMIVVDGASTDGTVDLIKQSPVQNLRWISEPDCGIYDAMNKGLAMAKGDYVVFLNAGDAFHAPDVLERLADAAIRHDYPGIIYGQTDIVDASRRRIGERHLRAPEHLSLRSFADGMLVCHQAFVALRKITDVYDTDYRFSADYDWCIRCLQRSRRNHYLDTVLIDYLNEGMTTKNFRRSLMERFRIMAKNYGTIPTVLRHIKFLRRYILRKGNNSKN